MEMRSLKRFICLLLFFNIYACSGDIEAPYVERSVNALYNTALDALEANEYSKATKSFEEVERQHPYSVWATKAQLMAAYANYEANKYDDAIIGLDRFIQLHPGNSDTPYAYYLKALSYYEQITDISRDQLVTEKALKALRNVVRRYPQTKYARSARLKIDLTRDHLAGKEMSIGRFYLRKKEYTAAINRFNRVINQYQTTTHVPEALHRVAEAYTALGLPKEAKKAASVLGHNYPGSEWYTDSYALMMGKNLSKKKKGFLNRIWNSVF